MLTTIICVVGLIGSSAPKQVLRFELTQVQVQDLRAELRLKQGENIQNHACRFIPTLIDLVQEQ